VIDKKVIHAPKYFFLLKKFQIKNAIENKESHQNEVIDGKDKIEKNIRVVPYGVDTKFFNLGVQKKLIETNKFTFLISW